MRGSCPARVPPAAGTGAGDELAARVEAARLAEVREAIQRSLDALGRGDAAQMSITERGLEVVVVSDDVFFADASDALQPGGVEVLDAAQAAATGRDVLVHDAGAADPSAAFAISRLDDTSMAHVPVGVFRAVSRPTYDDLVRDQLDEAREAAGGPATDEDLAALLAGGDTWTVG